jgi:hypothetical protein
MARWTLAVRPWHDSRVILLIIGAVVVLLLVLLRVADRHNERHGHRRSRMSDIRSASRTQRQETRVARRLSSLPRPQALQDGARKPGTRKKQQND